MSVGIIMPYYNEPELLIKSVNAVCNQTYKNWTLYIIDDGSELNKRAINVLKLDPESEKKVIFVYKSNGGVSSARNLAIDLIKSNDNIEYVAYCDSDDVWDSNYLKYQLLVLDQSSPYLMGRSITFYNMVYTKPRFQFVDGSPAFPHGIADYPAWPGLHALLRSNFIYISGVAHEKKCLSVGYFDKDLNSIEDWDFWTRIATQFNVVKNEEVLFTYTVKTDGNGAKSSEEVYKRYYAKHSALITGNTVSIANESF